MELMTEDSVIKKLPVTFRLYERKGAKTDRLIQQIRNMSAAAGVEDAVHLSTIKPNPADSAANILLYTLTFNPKDPVKAESTVKFAKAVFEKFFSNYPSYVEPQQTPTTEGSDESSSYN